MGTGEHASGGRNSALEAKVKFLKRPGSYPENPPIVEALETHMSWVFLTERLAYKLKKPVRHEFLDFSTLAARMADCDAEIRLNRRLAPDVYLGIVPLTLDGSGSLRLNGAGEPVDWLVKMRRLPSDQMLDQRIRRGRIVASELDPAARLLAQFYAAAQPLDISPGTYRKRFFFDIKANKSVLLEPRFAMPQDRVRQISAAQLAFVERVPSLLDDRARERRIVEGHGDLRPEHIYLGPKPAIIDCIEFNREFRCLDAAEELAFLAMECEFQGAPAVGRRFLKVYGRVTEDAPSDSLVGFYKCFRACLRCKLSLWHVSDEAVADPERWRRKARRYLDFAHGYARGFADGAELQGADRTFGS